MGEITTVGLDIAKRIFVAHCADAAGNTVLTKKLRREEVHTF
ncbi:IS110 family transposase, partial [Rhodopseudomonas sp. BR0G17]|nr:IS110 family transposase [Rhodopseudomonas sp. BR0G17]